MSDELRYAIIGLGKLGASMAAAIASRGYNVIGVDVSQQVVDAINDGHAPVQETDLEEYVSQNRERLRATMNHHEAVVGSDISFVIVPTPSNAHGAFSLQYAKWAFAEIGRALRDVKDYHLVVLVSTVLPGSTRYGLLPVLEKESAKKGGRDFGLCYSPDFIALGSIIHDYLNPDFNLVGELDARCGDLLQRSYSELMLNSPPCRRMSLENAELAKVALNTYVTTKIAYANMVAEIAERLPGGDIDAVTNAIGSDSRIGSKYLKGALGYGGPCFPRDNVALSFLARSLGVVAEIAETTHRSNRNLVTSLRERLPLELEPGTTVAVLGLSYKPFSHVVEESQSLQLAVELSRAGARVVGYDPLARDTARAEVADQVVVLDSLQTCLNQADVVLVTLPDPAYAEIRADQFREGAVVVDFWRLLEDELAGSDRVRWLPVGRSVDDEANAVRLAAIWERGGGE